MSNLRVFASAFLDGFSGAGLYERLRRPGAPTQVFADPPSERTEKAYVTEEIRIGHPLTQLEQKEIAQVGR